MREWLDSYARDHQHPVNQWLHWICVPLIVLSVMALLWTMPVPESLFRPGAWAVFVIVLAFAWYWKRSRRLGAALLIALALLALLCAWAFERLGPSTMRWLAACLFVAAWMGQFIGHIFEGRRPSFLTDLAYLLIGPAWLMEKLLNRLGIRVKA